MVIGILAAGRNHPALDELVGMFVQTLILRIRLNEGDTVAELLAQVRARSLEAIEHQETPFELLVERLNPARSRAYHPLIQVMLAWQNLPWTRDANILPLGGLEVTPQPTAGHRTPIDLGLALVEQFSESGQSVGIIGEAIYRTDVYDPATVEAVLTQLEQTLQSFTTHPQRRLRELDLFSSSEHTSLPACASHPVPTNIATAGLPIPQASGHPGSGPLVQPGIA